MKQDIAYGFHAVGAALRQGRVAVLYIDRQRRDVRARKLLDLAEEMAVETHAVDTGRLDGLAGAGHQGVVAVLAAVKADPRELTDRIGPQAVFLALDEVTDPRNLGACLRVADAFGVDAVILPKDRTAGLTPVVRKAACGAAETIAVHYVTNLVRSLRELQEEGVWVAGAAGEGGIMLREAHLHRPLCWVMGAEGKGLRRLTREACDELVAIPMLGTVESLNVSVATAVCLYETRRRDGAAQG